MASTYNPDELAGNGINLKENLTSGTTYTFNVTASADGQAYLFMGNELHNSSLPEYFSGSVIDNLTDVTGSIIEPYKASVVTFKGNSSSFDFTPSINIIKEDVIISATGHIGVNIGPGNFGFTYSNFSSTEDLSLLGTTSVIEDILYLTTAVNGQVGNVYRTNSIRYDRNFSAQWSTFIGGGTDEIKADGYCIQWTPTNNTTGSPGGGVGYVSTAINAITFLTYTNNNYTWYKNGVSQGATSVSAGLWRQTLYFWGDYNHSAQTFALYWNTTNSKPGSPNKTFTSFSFDSGLYYMGFGAATGGSNDNHELLSWALMFT
jgi:hypothetical protein